MSDTHPIRPEDVLGKGIDELVLNGVNVRKGSVAAFIANAKLLDSAQQGTALYIEVMAQLRALAPALLAVGLLDVFEPRSAEVKRILADA